MMPPKFASSVTRALGVDRVQDLVDLSLRAQELTATVGDEWCTEFWVAPMTPAQAEGWRRSAIELRETWSFVNLKSGGVLAVDEVPDHALSQPVAAVTYPALLSQLCAWWLFHAWRGADLVTDAVSGIASWRLTTAPLAARALIEQVGCLLHECRSLFNAWADAKAGRAGSAARAEMVRSKMTPVLVKTSMGTRISGSPERLQAPNVLTYVKRLEKMTGEKRYSKWYDWLSDASHPAFAARIASSSEAMVHETGALAFRFVAKGPLSSAPLDNTGKAIADRIRPQFNEVAAHIADSTAAAAKTYFEALIQARQLVDDFAITTRAGALTQRHLWPAPLPARTGHPCPCGCNRRDGGIHRWGQPTPVLNLLGS